MNLPCGEHGLSLCASGRATGSGSVENQASLQLSCACVDYVRDIQGCEGARADLFLYRWEDQKRGKTGA